jgi:hypothetical protein
MAKIDKILGSISPLYGAASGQGLFGNALGGLGDAMGPMGGLMPMLASSQRKKLRARREEDAKNAGEDTGMKRGGAVKKMAKGGSTASKRADGCATKGKTKGRFV